MRSNLEALNALLSKFGSAVLLEQITPRYRYRVPKGDKSVGDFFSFMEDLSKKLNIDEYSASQTTLEQIFNGFAREGEKEVVSRNFKLNTNDPAQSSSSKLKTKEGFEKEGGKNYNKHKDLLPDTKGKDLSLDRMLSLENIEKSDEE
mmetsp:Transcript_42663/g.49939  ORF Transcript_42663/g.49939 Transcript_42663/m.49939 type:complete len:147 (-) Transcript_42663:30-470(-)